MKLLPAVAPAAISWFHEADSDDPEDSYVPLPPRSHS